MSRAIDETGNKYGKLVVIERVENYATPNGNLYACWLCKCICNNEVTVLGSSLRRGRTKSCGCLRKEVASETNALPEGQAAFNYLYRTYKKKAKKRNYKWHLAKEDFAYLTKQNCFYCDVPPMQKSRVQGYCNGNYIYNGIDRLDNSEGYTIDNVVPCCMKCNYMKRDSSLEEFFRHINIILSKHPNRIAAAVKDANTATS